MEAKGQAAVVTGAASGLGAETARALAAAGARVALMDVDGEGLERVAGETGGLAVICDVADAASAEAAMAAAGQAHGPPRILINCAGIGPAAKIVGDDGPMPLEFFQRVIGINLIGTFNMLRLAAAAMKPQQALENGERGLIVNTASVAAYEGQIGQIAYASSKGGVVAMTLPAARELSRSGIRVVTIAPGIFATPMLLGLPDEVQEALGASVPFPPRLGRPDEYAGLVMHILENVMINGEVIRLDGALRMQPK